MHSPSKHSPSRPALAVAAAVTMSLTACATGTTTSPPGVAANRAAAVTSLPGTTADWPAGVTGSPVAAASPLTVAAAGRNVPGTPSATTAPPVEIPDTPVGQQLRWLLDAPARAPIGQAELAEHFTPAFLELVPADKINETLAGLRGIQLQKIIGAVPTDLIAHVVVGAQTYKLALSVDATGKISGARFTEPATPQPSPTSWEELDRRARKAAARVGFLAAEVKPDGTCRPVHAIAGRQARPLGSMFKLYVLGAVAKKIEQGRFSWDTAMTIKPELKSLPSGQLQDRPDNSQVPVLEAAKLMIAISDNTGADLLLHQAGRTAVEDRVRAWRGQVKRNTPFLTTRELFALKGADYPRHSKEFLSRDTAGRRGYLSAVVDKLPLSGITPWAAPRELDTVEWFGSPADICRAYAGLAKSRDKRIGEVMSQNTGGIKLPAKEWPTVWYKGGSEPGVLDLSYLARTPSGRTFMVTAMASDPAAALQEDQVYEELVALSRGAFALLKSS
ncbi:serine hydrolase [Nonomuraea aurantiaca]|uniref:serine hydrolase n=1 Tax=Nonomuraea aurantiaca TaxID=2878562 RepID=UPI001CD92056|nr:serine hydrolase [Nonomuraea aurantiaca]MCA2223202.1 serine hydrolase [Nonomuraea aurantiaca]